MRNNQAWPCPVQKSIGRTVRTQGRGIHSGLTCRLSLSPLPENSGILFRRTGLKTDIPCSPSAVSNLTRSVGIVQNGASVTTIEHLLAALHMTGVSNILIETDAEELPFLDGGAHAFIRLLRSARIIRQNAPLKPLAPAASVTVGEKGDFITYLPSVRTVITCVTDFPHPLLKGRAFALDLDRDDPVRNVARARTFGFQREVESLQASGLGRGGTLENTLLFTETGIVNRKQNYPDEAVRHKILDFLGDMYLAGRPIRGVFLLYKNGHKLDLTFLKAMLEAENRRPS